MCHTRPVKQHGGGVFSLLLGLAATVLVIILTIKLAPLYFDDYAIGKILASLSKAPNIDNAPQEQVAAWLEKGLTANNIVLADNEVSIQYEDDQLHISVYYERRLPVVHNIDLVLTFTHDWTPNTL